MNDVCQRGKIRILWDWLEERGHWNLCFSRNLNDQELNDIEQFFARLQGKIVNGEEDKSMWMDLRNETFSVKSLYAALELESSTSFLAGVVWNPQGSSKVSFFVWEACWKKVDSRFASRKKVNAS